ncbi:MATE family efflux transporter [Bacillus gobiensis]|uniref:MATE family efflux transporter n=1 Tax=Bacillus gobiensis TaxID=1441095 RepID=UPI003D212D58
MKQHDFTEGNLIKQLMLFSAPIMLTNLLQVSSQFIDSLWVGNLIGSRSLGAVSVASVVLFTVLSFIIGLNNATLTILSQQKGKNNIDGLKSYLNAFVVILTILAVCLGIIGFVFAEFILMLLQTPLAMLPEAAAFLKINFLGILFLFGYNFIATVLRALGDSKTPLRFVIIAVVLNIILAPIFISGFNWGVEGAAIATVLSQGLAFVYGMIVSIKKGLIPFVMPSLPKKEEVLLIMKLGIPSGLQMTVIAAGSTAIMSVVNSFGEDAVSGFGAAQRLDSLILLPAMALGTAVNSMAGQNMGAHRFERVHKISWYAVIYNFCIMLTIALLLVFFAEFGVRLFLQEEAAVQFGTDYLKIIAFFYPFLGINFILNGTVRAAGAMYAVLILNIISFWVLRYPMTYLFSSMIGENGIALGMGVSFFISSFFAVLYYRYGKWETKKLFVENKERVK